MLTYKNVYISGTVELSIFIKIFLLSIVCTIYYINIEWFFF